MKIALVSDIHANLEALQSVLKDIAKEGAETVHFLGDAVGYGCSPNECVALLKKMCDIRLLGNHDYAAMGLEATTSFNQVAQTSMEWTLANLSRKTVSLLADFEMQASFEDYHLVHASPDYPEDWNYILNQEQAAEQFEHFKEKVCFVGHSHLPMIFSVDGDGQVESAVKSELAFEENKKYIVNVGSVGQPRDNDARACYVILDTVEKCLRYRRVEYDITAVQKKMRQAMLPDFLVERIAVGR